MVFGIIAYIAYLTKTIWSSISAISNSCFWLYDTGGLSFHENINFSIRWSRQSLSFSWYYCTVKIKIFIQLKYPVSFFMSLLDIYWISKRNYISISDEWHIWEEFAIGECHYCNIFGQFCFEIKICLILPYDVPAWFEGCRIWTVWVVTMLNWIAQSIIRIKYFFPCDYRIWSGSWLKQLKISTSDQDQALPKM